jgi:hypothetical protein
LVGVRDGKAACADVVAGNACASLMHLRLAADLAALVRDVDIIISLVLRAKDGILARSTGRSKAWSFVAIQAFLADQIDIVLSLVFQTISRINCCATYLSKGWLRRAQQTRLADNVDVAIAPVLSAIERRAARSAE